MSTPYLPIGEHAFVSDCHSTALVIRHGSVDWACFRRFDSATAFCRILDHDRVAQQGRRDEAAALFDRVLACANDLGLSAEEVAAGSGELLGNFPQAFTHLGVLVAARRLDGVGPNAIA